MSQSPQPQPDLVTPSGPDNTTAPAARSLSIIIPAYNHLAEVILLLRSITRDPQAVAAGMAERLQVIVQDDASPDVNLPELLGAPAQVERNPVNLGFSGTCNAGAARSAGDILLFLNQDTRARPGWFEPLMAAFDNPAVGIVGPKLVFPVKDGQPETVQSCGGLYGANKGPFHRMIGWLADDYRVNVPERVSWTTGAALAVRRELFVQAGGFNVAYKRGYFEDCGLCEQVKALGYEVWYEPRAVFEHDTGTSGGVSGDVFRNNSMLFHKLWDDKIEPDSRFSFVNF